MKDHLVEFSVGAMKIAPPAVVAAAAQVGQVEPQSILIWLSIVYTVGLLAQLVSNNGRRWASWLARIFRWFRRRLPRE